MDISAAFEFFQEKIHSYKEKKLQVFASSSFQTHSIPMLHMISRIDPSIPIYFLQTGFHFPETLSYRNEISELLGLEVRELRSPIPKSQQQGAKGGLLFSSDPDYCCYLNKTLPMEPVLAANDIWITGVRRDQSNTRKNFAYEAKGPFETMRFHPMLDWTNKMIWEYRKEHSLPEHPLEKLGFLSVGCAPCTRKFDFDEIEEGRTGRWAGMKKTECGLHTDLIEK